jgi:hypothetical protein
VVHKEVEQCSWGGAWHYNKRNLISVSLNVNNLAKAADLHLAFSLSSAAGAVPNLSLQIIWYKHLRKNSCSASYSHPILWLGLCQTKPAEYWVQLCLCPHRLLLCCSLHLTLLTRVFRTSDHLSFQCQNSSLLKLLCRTMSESLLLYYLFSWQSPRQTLWQSVPRLPDPWSFLFIKPPEYLNLKQKSISQDGIIL